MNRCVFIFIYTCLLVLLILPHIPSNSLFASAKLLPVPCPNISEPCNGTYDPNLPDIPCPLVPPEFLVCSFDIPPEQGGCKYFGGSAFKKPTKGLANCTILEGIECIGSRTFVKILPCKFFGGKHFLTALVLAIFAGLCGADRFYLGHTCYGIFKMLTLGGVGVWWIVDIILMVTGTYYTADGSSWEKYY